MSSTETLGGAIVWQMQAHAEARRITYWAHAEANREPPGQLQARSFAGKALTKQKNCDIARVRLRSLPGSKAEKDGKKGKWEEAGERERMRLTPAFQCIQD